MEVPDIISLLHEGRYVDVLNSDTAKPVLGLFVRELVAQRVGILTRTDAPLGHDDLGAPAAVVAVGLAALNAFLQANVTGPVLSSLRDAEAVLAAAFHERVPADAEAADPAPSLAKLRRRCTRALDVDGVAVYPHAPHVELFCLAHWLFAAFPALPSPAAGGSDSDAVNLSALRGEGVARDAAQTCPAWLRLRVRSWHHRLFPTPTLGSGAVFNRATQWSEVPSLREEIERDVAAVESIVLGEGESRTEWGDEDRVRFLVEKANICMMLSQSSKAKQALERATELNGFVYALSGALGKRTRFQEKSTSQLVVLARSRGEGDEAPTNSQPAPDALALNDDTLLENIEFTPSQTDVTDEQASIPTSLRGLSPENQPRLAPLDQIILLTEATLKEAFSPTDTLTSEEILPYATRVVSDKSTNWQIYTQALLVRSRIEQHRSRTVERGVLQMQALVDQVIADATRGASSNETTSTKDKDGEHAVPSIQVTGPEAPAMVEESKPTSFFPVAKDSESAPGQARLRFIHTLASPPRWHLEAELGYAWAGVGSLVSALEIFKRLRLWAEVALCLASRAAADDEDGRGSGGEEKAKAIVRWRLFQQTGTTAAHADIATDEGAVDISELKSADFAGPERDPPPPDAPRLLCILGDLETEPSHYERAWVVSRKRYARAQRSLGEHYLQHKEWQAAREAYKKAVGANRLSPELWSRLGDISLRLGAFAEAADAFGRAIGAASDAVGGEDAKTWSNLGSALYSLYVEAMARREENGKRGGDGDAKSQSGEGETDDEIDATTPAEPITTATQDPATLLSRALTAYKRGATLAQTNWRIWDNVLTLASRARPPAALDMVQALRRIVALRATEDALDTDVLRLLVTECVVSKPPPAAGADGPPRGTEEKAVCDLLERDVVPLITRRSELWALVGRARVWRRDLSGAVDAAEKGWRAAVGGAGAAAAMGGSSTAGGDGGKGNWLVDKEAWDKVVARTDELVSLLENYGPEVESIGARWRGKARSAVRSVLGKARESWEGDEGWGTLQGLMDGLQ